MLTSFVKQARVLFAGRGKIVDLEATPGVGTVVVEDDGNQQTVLWKIGQRKKKSSELTLPATVRFAKSTQKSSNGSSSDGGDERGADSECGSNEDPFCTGSNLFVRLSFQVNDYSMGGCGTCTMNTGSPP